MSSREYLHRQAVNVLTMFPAKASNASIQELQAIPANIRSPDKALFWNITCPIPRAMINSPSFIVQLAGVVKTTLDDF